VPERYQPKPSFAPRISQANSEPCTIRLFLGSSSVLLLGLRTLLALANQTRLGASVAQLAVSSLLAGVVGDLALGDLGGVDDGEGLVGLLDVGAVAGLLGGLGVLGGSLAVLGRLALAREEDEAALVGLQALDVGLEGLLGKVLAARVDGDTDGGRELAGNAGLL